MSSAGPMSAERSETLVGWEREGAELCPAGLGELSAPDQWCRSSRLIASRDRCSLMICSSWSASSDKRETSRINTRSARLAAASVKACRHRRDLGDRADRHHASAVTPVLQFSHLPVEVLATVRPSVEDRSARHAVSVRPAAGLCRGSQDLPGTITRRAQLCRRYLLFLIHISSFPLHNHLGAVTLRAGVEAPIVLAHTCPRSLR